MGFYLVAKRRDLGDEGYMRASIFSMIFLRCAMLAAGVREELIYKKFLANDRFLVTPLQARTIAERLNAWLKGRRLRIDLAEENKRAKQVNSATLKVFEAVGARKQKSVASVCTMRMGRRRRRHYLHATSQRSGAGLLSGTQICPDTLFA